jgi:hypothetical protein
MEFKNLKKIYRLSYGFLFFVISISGEYFVFTTIMEISSVKKCNFAKYTVPHLWQILVDSKEFFLVCRETCSILSEICSILDKNMQGNTTASKNQTEKLLPCL